MPYITPQRRQALAAGDRPKTVGELNYQITLLLDEYVSEAGLSYQTINDVSGVMTCANAEFYRRVAVPYETRKIEENGDVYSEGHVS
jgi:hypothetical protein